MFTTIEYAKSGHVATITLNRPEVVNVYSVQMRDDLYQALQAVGDDSDVQGAILTGAGPKGFCAGADLREFGTAPSQAMARSVRWERDVWGVMSSLNKPLVAAIHGFCLGLGVEIACLCDFRIATAEATFGTPEVALGLVPGAGGTQTLMRVVGQARAMELLLTGKRIDAQVALDMGLITKIVPPGQHVAAGEALLEQVLQHPAAAVAAAKTTVYQGMDLPLVQALEAEYRKALTLASVSSK